MRKAHNRTSSIMIVVLSMVALSCSSSDAVVDQQASDTQAANSAPADSIVDTDEVGAESQPEAGTEPQTTNGESPSTSSGIATTTTSDQPPNSDSADEQPSTSTEVATTDSSTPDTEATTTTEAESAVSSTPTPSSGFPPVNASGPVTVDLQGFDAPASAMWEEVKAGEGATPRANDAARIEYTMYSWLTGTEVESTDDFGGSILVALGESLDPSHAVVPQTLQDAILAHQVGSRFVVGFPDGMADLPFYFDPGAYLLVVDLVGVE